MAYEQLINQMLGMKLQLETLKRKVDVENGYQADLSKGSVRLEPNENRSRGLVSIIDNGIIAADLIVSLAQTINKEESDVA